MSAARISALEDRVTALELGEADLLALKARIQRVLHGELGMHEYRVTAAASLGGIARVAESTLGHWIDVLEGRA